MSSGITMYTYTYVCVCVRVRSYHHESYHIITHIGEVAPDQYVPWDHNTKLQIVDV